MLDMSCVLNDPLLSDEFKVRRSAETVGLNGRVAKTPQLFEGLRGIVTPQEPSTLQRRDDSQMVSHTIMVQCEFALRDASFGFQPDTVIWNGIEYLVVQAIPYQRIAGYTQALCTSTRATDKPQ